MMKKAIFLCAIFLVLVGCQLVQQQKDYGELTYFIEDMTSNNLTGNLYWYEGNSLYHRHEHVHTAACGREVSYKDKRQQQCSCGIHKS